MKDKVIYECTIEEFFCSYDGLCELVDDKKYHQYGYCCGFGDPYGVGEKCPFFGMDPNSKVKIVVEVK